MARWKIKNVGMKGVAMAVPENVVKTSDFDFFSQEEAEVFFNIRHYILYFYKFNLLYNIFPASFLGILSIILTSKADATSLVFSTNISFTAVTYLSSVR